MNCEVSKCENESSHDIGIWKRTRVFLILPGAKRIHSISLCKEHYQQTWESLLEILKNE